MSLVTRQDTAARNIAQVFQVPVVHDTMSVRNNLAFPLRNHVLNAAYVAARLACRLMQNRIAGRDCAL